MSDRQWQSLLPIGNSALTNLTITRVRSGCGNMHTLACAAQTSCSGAGSAHLHPQKPWQALNHVRSTPRALGQQRAARVLGQQRAARVLGQQRAAHAEAHGQRCLLLRLLLLLGQQCTELALQLQLRAGGRAGVGEEVGLGCGG